MTKLLEKAIKEVSQLPKDEQDIVAAIILEEMASEERWTEAFGNSQDQLAKLAEEAIKEFRSGQTRPFSFDD